MNKSRNKPAALLEINEFKALCSKEMNHYISAEPQGDSAAASNAINQLLCLVFERIPEAQRVEALAFLFETWHDHSHLIVSNWGRIRPRDYELVFQFLSAQKKYQWRKRPIKTVAIHMRNLYYGGSEADGTAFANWLACIKDEHGIYRFKVIIITDDLPSEKDRFIEPHITRCSLPEWDSTKVNDIWAEKLVAIFAEYQIDMFIQSMWFMFRHGIWDMILVKTCPIRPAFVQRLGGSFVNILDLKNNLSDYYRYPDALIALAEFNGRIWQTYNARTYLVPNLPNTMPNATMDTTTDYGKNPSVLWISRLAEKQKQPYEFLHIAKLVNAILPDAHFDIVGGADDPSYKMKLEKTALKMGLSETVTFHGYQTNTGYYYEKASVLLMTSKWEGSPNVLYEAASFALPVVMYEIPELDFNKQFPHRKSFYQYDAKGAADEIVHLLTDETYYNETKAAMKADFERYITDGEKCVQSGWHQLVCDLETAGWPKESYFSADEIQRLMHSIQCRQTKKPGPAKSRRLRQRLRTFLSKHFL